MHWCMLHSPCNSTHIDQLQMQRICDDVPAFTEGSVALVIGLVRKVFNIVAFSGWMDAFGSF